MIEIIPAIDLIDGKCVRLSQGDFSQRTTYSDDPLSVAKAFESAGLRRLHVVDLDGAKSGKLTSLRVLEAIARNTDLLIDFGGGIKTDDDIASVYDAGASMATVGSIAVRHPERFFDWIGRYGDERVLLGTDIRGGKISIDAWQTATDTSVVPFLSEQFRKGIRQVFVTDIARDGLLKGPSIGLYEEIIKAIPDLRLIASGGVSRIEDITDLERIGCSGVIVGKALYEGRIKLQDLADRQSVLSTQI